MLDQCFGHILFLHQCNFAKGVERDFQSKNPSGYLLQVPRNFQKKNLWLIIGSQKLCTLHVCIMCRALISVFRKQQHILCMYIVPSTYYQLRMGKVLTVLTAPFLRALLYCISICHILQILFVLCLSQSDSDNNNEAQRNRTCMASSFWYMTKV